MLSLQNFFRHCHNFLSLLYLKSYTTIKVILHSKNCMTLPIHSLSLILLWVFEKIFVGLSFSSALALLSLRNLIQFLHSFRRFLQSLTEPRHSQIYRFYFCFSEGKFTLYVLLKILPNISQNLCVLGPVEFKVLCSLQFSKNTKYFRILLSLFCKDFAMERRSVI